MIISRSKCRPSTNASKPLRLLIIHHQIVELNTLTDSPSLFAPCMDDSQLSSSLTLWHWVEVAAMYPGSVRSACCRPTMNIREWVPHQSHGLDCPWCKAGLAHHGPTVLSSN